MTRAMTGHVWLTRGVVGGEELKVVQKKAGDNNLQRRGRNMSMATYTIVRKGAETSRFATSHGNTQNLT